MAENPFTSEKRKDNKNPKKGNNLYWIYGLILVFLFIAVMAMDSSAGHEVIDSRKFDELVEKQYIQRVFIVNDKEVEIFLTKEALQQEDFRKYNQPAVWGREQPHLFLRIVSADKFVQKLEENGVSYEAIERTNYVSSIFSFLLPILIIVGIYIFFMRRMGGAGPGGQIFNIGKSKASLFDKENTVKVTFDNVAGLEEAKEEVKEVVDFLKNPKKFTKLGGHIPKGVLLVGPPGTGKTLLAKAVAGEAQVPFFSLSGSDFVEMFVGVGAARVRDLFKQAKEKAPCIIFIDEIDAIGRSRGKSSFTGGNDERENTLNQLLVEMDGFGTDTGVIIMAATNRPDVLDSALLRPGRFDRQISVDRPDIKGREQIFMVHLAGIAKSPNVDARKLAAQTPGFVGADIMNVCNEAALIAARRNKEAVDMQDFQDAIDRVIGGLEKKNKIISPEEKKIVAYHEAGHAIAGWFLEHADPLVKVSIVPRGVAALGYAQYLPKEQYLYTYDQLIDTICMSLGGRVAEDVVFGKVSTGAQNDLERITKLSYGMVTLYGMNDKIGNVSFNDPQQEFPVARPYSESTAQTIDEEVRKIISESYIRTRNLIVEKREQLEILALALLEKEVIFQNDLEGLIGKRPFENPTTYQAYLDAVEPPPVANPPVTPSAAETTTPDPAPTPTETNKDSDHSSEKPAELESPLPTEPRIDSASQS